MKAIIRNIVFACPEESLHALAAFYGELLGMRVIREDWLVIARDGSSLPRLAFGDGAADSYEPPRWPHTDFPQQAHLDITVHDLEAAEESVRRLGATQLQDRGDYRSFADPVGHPFCLSIVTLRVVAAKLEAASPAGSLASSSTAPLPRSWRRSTRSCWGCRRRSWTRRTAW